MGSCTFSPNGTEVAIATEKHIGFYDVNSGEKLRYLENVISTNILCAKYLTKEGKYI